MDNPTDLGLGPVVEPVRTCVLTDDPLVRAALSHALVGAEQLELVGGVDDCDVALWDPGVDADLEDRLGELARIEAPVVALLEDSRDATRAVAAGARGALLREVDSKALATGVVAVHLGLVVIDGTWAQSLSPEPPSLADPLTDREREVLDLLARGLSNPQIASELGITLHTSKFHVRAILDKLGASTRTEAVVLAARQGWLRL